MPIWLRKFTFNEINEFYIKEKEEFEKSLGKEQLTANSNMPEMAKTLPKITPPDFVSKVKRPKK